MAFERAGGARACERWGRSAPSLRLMRRKATRFQHLLAQWPPRRDLERERGETFGMAVFVLVCSLELESRLYLLTWKSERAGGASRQPASLLHKATLLRKRGWSRTSFCTVRLQESVPAAPGERDFVLGLWLKP